MATRTAKAETVVEIGVFDFTFDHDTKGAVQYKQEPPAGGGRPEIGSIYLTKEFLAKQKNTTRLRVTVETVS